MALPPVVDRELRVASRRAATYWRRSLTGASGVAVFGWLILTQGNTYGMVGSGVPMGRTIFDIQSGLALVYAYLAGVLLTSDCISSEKREGTLGLLFLTDLRPWQIALGKLAATSVSASFRLLSLFPVLSLALLMGGVNLAQVGRTSLTLVACLILSLTTGLAISVYSRESIRAAWRTQVALIVITFGPWTAGWIWAVVLKRAFGLSDDSISRQIDWVMWISPLHAWDQATSDSPNGNYWVALAYTLAVSIITFVVAVRHLPRSWQDRPTQVGKNPGFRPLYAWNHRPPEWRKRWLASLPLSWLFLRGRFRGDLVLSILGIWVVLAVIVWTMVDVSTGGGGGPGAPDFGPFFYFPASLTCHLMLKMWMANESTRRWTEDRRSGAMEWLLVAPLSPRDFIRSGLAALRVRFGWAFAMVALFDVLMVGLVLPLSVRPDVGQDLFYFTLWRVAFLALDLVSIAWLGLWVGISSRHSRPQNIPFLRVVFLPLMVVVAVSPFTIALTINSGGEPGLWKTVFYLSLLFLTNDLGWLWYARQRLYTQFRQRAGIPPGEKAGWFTWSRARRPTEVHRPA